MPRGSEELAKRRDGREDLRLLKKQEEAAQPKPSVTRWLDSVAFMVRLAREAGATRKTILAYIEKELDGALR